MSDAVGTTHDILLAGEGYQLAAGSYRRSVMPLVPGGATGEVVYRQLRWRGRQVSAADGESVWASEGFLPVDGGRGLQLAPAGVLYTGVAGAASGYAAGISYANTYYLGAGTNIYSVAVDGAGNFSSLTLAYAGPGEATQLCLWNGHLRVCFGSHGYRTFDGTTWGTVAQAADRLIQYAGVLLRAYNGALYWTEDEATWVQLPFYHRITAFLPWGEALLIGTDEGLFVMRAHQEPKAPDLDPNVYDWFVWEIQPLFFLNGADSRHFLSMQSYGGWVYYWSAGHLWRWRGGAAERVGPVGSLTGMCLVGPYLCVGLWTADDGYQLWLHDGEDDGWWRFRVGSGTYESYVVPMAVDSVANVHLMAWSSGTRYLTRWNFNVEERDFTTGQSAPYLSLPALDGGCPEVVKHWVALGLDFGVPEGASALTGAPATWYLDYSTDMGATWTTAGSVQPATLYQSYSVALTPVSARRLWLRVRVTDGGADNPRLRSVWARYRQGVTAGVRRRWEFRVRCSDQVVQHTGARDERDGRTLANDLLALVGAGGVAFRDVDDVATGVQRTAQVLEAEQLVGRNLEHRTSESEVRLVLEAIE